MSRKNTSKNHTSADMTDSGTQNIGESPLGLRNAVNNIGFTPIGDDPLSVDAVHSQGWNFALVLRAIGIRVDIAINRYGVSR